MEDNAPKENPPADFNKLDLTQLQGFSFGTQWSQEKSSPSDRRDRADSGADRPRRDDRRDGPGGGAPDRRDRRTFRKPAGAPGSDAAPHAPAPGGAPERREFSGDRGPRPGGGGEYRGGPRRDGPGGGERGPRYGHGAPQERGPYDSPFYNVTFYPEDTSFNTLVQTIRKSCRTIELFEIARTVVAKTDRFVVVVAPKNAAPAEGASSPEGIAKPAKAAFHISVPDGLPFESDEAAVAHVLSTHLDKFFDSAEVEVDPPKGNYQVINKCGVTGELLGPPRGESCAHGVRGVSQPDRDDPRSGSREPVVGEDEENHALHVETNSRREARRWRGHDRSRRPGSHSSRGARITRSSRSRRRFHRRGRSRRRAGRGRGLRAHLRLA